MPPRFHLAHLLLGDLVSSLDASSFATAMAEHATINSMASCKENIFLPQKHIRYKLLQDLLNFFRCKIHS
jgi:hypothetical protein